MLVSFENEELRQTFSAIEWTALQLSDNLVDVTFLETLSAEGSNDWQVLLEARHFSLDLLGNAAWFGQLGSFEDRNQLDDG